ncbi:hypothetical protein SOVF_026420 [Spinacia oleracea]|nr:hypothetical protein SOVF_026420 [Spinacia oleracea]
MCWPASSGEGRRRSWEVALFLLRLQKRLSQLHWSPKPKIRRARLQFSAGGGACEQRKNICRRFLQIEQRLCSIFLVL